MISNPVPQTPPMEMECGRFVEGDFSILDFVHFEMAKEPGNRDRWISIEEGLEWMKLYPEKLAILEEEYERCVIRDPITP